MTWIREVAHVAWKDVRQQQWLVIAYLGLVAVATWRALLLGSVTPMNNGWEVLPILVVIFGAILAASFIQTDSPTQSDAFWASHPFRSSAVLGAKLLLVFTIVIGLPLVGQVVAM